MSPHLTIRGLWVFIAALIFIGAGAFAERPVLLMMGEVMIGVLAISFFLCIAAALALDRRFVSVVCVDPEDDAPRDISRATTGAPLGLHFMIQNHAWVPLYGLQIAPFGAAALQAEGAPAQYHLPSGARLGVEIEFTPRRSGRWCLHGFDIHVADPLGLLATRDYLPCTHVIESFPPMQDSRRFAGRELRELAPRHGLRHSRHSGHGSHVRELREYQSGDPLRHIAWKASARARRLISRDFEREVNFNVYLLLDISTSMRGGMRPGQKLEQGVNIVTELAAEVSRAKDHVGLMTFDEKLYGHITPASSLAHIGQMMRHLVGLSAVVDPDLSELDDAELLNRLADYLLVQERLDFRRGADPEAGSGVNSALMERWVQSVLARDRARFGSAVLSDGVLNPTESPLRRFAQLRGLEIPYRAEARMGLKEMGLKQAIEQIVHAARDPQLIVIITDLSGVASAERLSRAVQLARIKGHALHFLLPYSPSDHADFAPERPPERERFQIVREIFTAQERDERLKLVSALRALGVPVDSLKPTQSALQALNQPRSGGRA